MLASMSARNLESLIASSVNKNATGSSTQFMYALNNIRNN